MSKSRWLSAVSLIVLVVGAGCSRTTAPPETPKSKPKPIFVHDLGEAKRPWTAKPLQNDPRMFQFAIVSDRTGGPRAGVFERALEKVNLLHPEFVMSVGDLINGYLDERPAIEGEWQEFGTFLAPLEMPFFYVSGNHDIYDEQSAKVWEEKYGRRYYSFIYQDVLFLCLDSQEDSRRYVHGGIAAEQVAWAKEVLKQHPDVRWTFVFMHQPLWLYDEEGNYFEKPYVTGFGDIEEALAERQYTVFAGHYHRYTKFERHDRNYYILGTTGGGSALRGPEHGEFDHGVWVTMTDAGPKIANLAIGGIHDDAVYTETMRKFEAGLHFEKRGDARAVELELELKNPFAQPLLYELGWTTSAESTWSISPPVSQGQVEPGSTQRVRVQFTRGVTQFPMPEAKLQLRAGGEYVTELELPISSLLFDYERSELRLARATKPPVLDGKLDDALWQSAPWATEFRQSEGFGRESEKTKVWAYYDATYLYVAFDCTESKMQALQLDSRKRDHLQWRDNSVEFVLRPDMKSEDYYQFIVNADGSVFDGKGKVHVYDVTFEAKTSKREDGYSVEIAIPWSELGSPSLKPGTELGLLLARNRPETDGSLQFPLMGARNHTPDRFGKLIVVK